MVTVTVAGIAAAVSESRTSHRRFRGEGTGHSAPNKVLQVWTIRSIGSAEALQLQAVAPVQETRGCDRELDLIIWTHTHALDFIHRRLS